MPRRRVGRWRRSECAGRCRSRHRPATAPVRVRDPAGGGPGAGEAPGADAPRSAPRQPAGLHPQVAEVLRAQPIEPAGPNTSTSPPHGRLRSAAPGSPVDHARRPPLHPVGREHREQRRGQVDDDRHAPAEQHPGEPPGAVRPARGPVDQEQAGVDHREHEQVDVHPLDRLGPPAGLLVLSVAGRGLVRCGSAALFQLRRHLVHLLNQLGLLERLAAGPSAPPHKGRSAVLDTWAPEAGAGGLGPWRDRRASASAVDKPSSAVPRSASTSSASSRPARANAPASPGGLAVGFLAVPASGRGRSSVPMVLAALREGERSRCGPSTGSTSRAAVGQVETIRLAVTHLHTDAYEIDIRGHRLTVDQPVEAGGENLGPTPTELFAASLAACVGFYAGRFLRRHGLAVEGCGGCGATTAPTSSTSASGRPARASPRAPAACWSPSVRPVLQILALDIGTDLLPALALGAERAEPDVMQRPPGPRTARLLDRRVLAFAAIVAMQMANAFERHSARSSLWSIGPLSNRLLVGRWPSRRSPCSPSSACHPCVTRSVSRRLPRRSGSRAGGAVAADRWRGDAQGTHPPPSSPTRGKAEGPHLTRSKRPAGTPRPGRSVGSEREIRPSLRESS